MCSFASPPVLEITGSTALPREAGGKARGLASILAAGLAVPRAWVVLPEAGDAEVRTLAHALETEGAGALAVRSSAADEDSGSASFAGIHESLLGVAPADLPEAVGRVALSPLTERAAAYRREMGLAPGSERCAVVVQAMVPAERAGVALGLGGGGGAVLVEAVEGLGERLVQGLETPEAWRLERVDAAWRVLSYRDRRQERALVAGDRRGRAESRLGSADAAPVLHLSEAIRIAEGVAALEEAAGVPLDVEWCIARDTLWFVQSRPRTRPVAPLPPGHTWTRANFREVLPEVPAALTRAFVLSSIRTALRPYMAPFASLLDPGTPLVECVYGRLVSNDTAYAALLEKLGVPRRVMDVTLGGGEGGEDRFEPMRVGRQLRRPVVMTRVLLRALCVPRKARRLIARYARVADRVRALRFETLSDDDLQPWLLEIPCDLGWHFAYTSMLVVAYLQHVQYAIASVLRVLPHPGAAMTRLVAPRLRTVSTRMTDELVELARAFRRWPSGPCFLAGLTEAHSAPDTWRAALPAELFRRVAAWVAAHGHRGPHESDLSATRYGDDWRLFAELLAPLVEAEREPESPETRRARLVREGEVVWQQVRARVGFVRRLALRARLHSLGRLLALREALRSAAVASLHVERAAFVEAGHRLARRGRVNAWDDVWFLEPGQLVRAFADTAFDAAAAVAREKGRLAAWRRVEVPNRFRSEDVGSFRIVSDVPATTQPVLFGTGISPGVAEGRARCLETPFDGPALQAGEILVAHATDPGWTALFARAGGVLVEMGGTLSHAGIVAREFGIPCVANVDGVMRKIRDGQWLRVDGTRGTVEVVEEPLPDARVEIDPNPRP